LAAIEDSLSDFSSSAFSYSPQDSEIQTAQRVGEAMVNVLQMVEERMYENNLRCINTLKPLLPPISESLEGFKSGEEEGHSSLPLG
jgi:hypothetical protein